MHDLTTHTTELPALLGQVTEHVPALSGAVDAFPWHDGTYRAAAHQALASMQMAAELTMPQQVRHHNHALQHALFADFCSGVATRVAGVYGDPINNAWLKEGRIVREVNAWGDATKIDHLTEHPLDGDIPIPLPGLQFLKLLRDNTIRVLVKDVKLIELRQIAVDPDPWLCVRVGDQWFRIVVWNSVNNYTALPYR